MQVVLVMFKADGERRSFSLPRDVTVIGRREDCDLRIPLGDVSRKHCRLVKDNGALKVEDLGSSNGTFHNGVRVQEAVVQPGDTIQIGPLVFAVQIDGVPSDDQIQPAQPEPAAAPEAGTLAPGAGAPGAEEVIELEALDALAEPSTTDADAPVELELDEEPQPNKRPK